MHLGTTTDNKTRITRRPGDEGRSLHLLVESSCYIQQHHIFRDSYHGSPISISSARPASWCIRQCRAMQYRCSYFGAATLLAWAADKGLH